VKKKSQKGFTLIELLVVIAIIAVLSSIVLVSLNAARIKGQTAAIKSNLKNAIPKAELTYQNSSPQSYATACATLIPIINAINNSGGVAKCVSNNTSWAISAKLSSDTSLNYSASPDGVGTWDVADASVSSMNWSTANLTCSGLGGRVPSIEEINSLYLAQGSTHPGFQNWLYMSNTGYPGWPDSVYCFDMRNGTLGRIYKTSSVYVRCIK